MTLQQGTTLQSELGYTVIVGELLGAGGQGSVYKVSMDGQEYALKWYHIPTESQGREAYENQRNAIKKLITKSPPDERFLWPKAYVYDDDNHFGYIMKLRDSRFDTIEQLYRGKLIPDDFGPYRTLATASIGMIDCFRKLHLGGLVYKDINLGGPFFDLYTGDVLICDNDNVRVDKESKELIYFMKFAAPELIKRVDYPNKLSDRHSLAVLLFMLWIRHHPLEGKRDSRYPVFGTEEEVEIYGKDPIFTFNPDDRRNHPDPAVHKDATDNWNRIPQFLREHFITAFTAGLLSPNDRLTDTQWVQAFMKVRDSLYICKRCNAESIYDQEEFKKHRHVTCNFCGHKNNPPPRIALGTQIGTAFLPKTVLMLTPRSKLYEWHLKDSDGYNAVVGEMVKHPTKNLWGLKNQSSATWNAKRSNGQELIIPPGKSLLIEQKMEVSFGRIQGRIRV